MTEPLLVLHTTEGSTMEGAIQTFIANNSRPHRLGDPARQQATQLVSWDRHARSLYNAPGGVETNNRGKVYQYEIVGFVQHIIDGRYPADWWDWLANDIRQVCLQLGVPLKFPYDFGSPPESTWATSPYILSEQEWQDASGIVGHLHAPENVNGHYDPGPVLPLMELLQPGRTRERLMPIGVATGSTASKLAAVVGDPEVYSWQVMMQAAGFYSGKLDGDFGPKSKAAGMQMRTTLDNTARQVAAQAKLLEQANTTEQLLREELEEAANPEPLTVMDPDHLENRELASRFRLITEALDMTTTPPTVD